jgi:hypothetical protein
MRTPKTLLASGGALVSLAILFAGVAQAADAPAPAPPAPAPPTTPTYICDNIMAVQPGVFGYTNCEGFGGVKKSGYYDRGGPTYMLIPRSGETIQKYRCHGGNIDTPTSVAPAQCTEVGSAVPSAQAPPPVPYGGPGGVKR